VGKGGVLVAAYPKEKGMRAVFSPVLLKLKYTRQRRQMGKFPMGCERGGENLRRSRSGVSSGLA